MKVIIAGSRHIHDASVVEAAIQESGFTITEVVSGNCRGPDRLGADWAFAHRIPVKVFNPDWSHGKGAGPWRNEAMALYSDALILIWDGQSRGSADVLRRAERHGLKVYVKRVDAPPTEPHTFQWESS